ncbi:MAG: serine--tRNA ligase [Solirubrobacterales bacterium]|nr:serine--tRNA ligase [Solirubrobacterales bacterium]
MLDLKAIRNDPQPVLDALARRKDGSQNRLTEALELDARRREILPRSEELSAKQNAANDAIASAKREGTDASAAIEEMKAISAENKQLKEELANIEELLATVQGSLPNPPDPTAADEDTEISRWGEGAPSGLDHMELAGSMIDLEAGARVAGSRFSYLKGDLVRLELAIVQFMVDKLSGEGFTPVIPPVLVRERALYGTGMFPDTEQQIYRVEEDELYLTGTSEVALASLHDGEILDAADLPLRYAGISPCFRREAGAAGKDTVGIFRVHQFEKVEMFVFCEPDNAEEEHERILAIEESIMQDLAIPYRVVNIAVDDLGSSAAKKFDIEAWLPSQQQYRELTSCSNTTDYQARRLGIRVRPEGGGSPVTANTLNGTAAALGRTIIAILENHQGENGVVTIPELLQNFGAPSTIGES